MNFSNLTFECMELLRIVAGDTQAEWQPYAALVLGLLGGLLGLRLFGGILDAKRTEWGRFALVFLVTAAVAAVGAAVASHFLADKITLPMPRAWILGGCSLLAILIVGDPLCCLLCKAEYLKNILAWILSLLLGAFVIIASNAIINTVVVGKSQAGVIQQRKAGLDEIMDDAAKPPSKQ